VYFCQTASLPTITMSEVLMPTPFVSVKAPSKLDFDELSITFVVDEEMKNWLEIFNWMRSTTNVENYDEFKSANTHTTTANLIILNSSKNPKINVTFEGLYPRTLGSLDFSSTVIDPEAFQCTATFSYRNYNIELL
jgi:predicted nucleotidyltransferase